MRIKTKLATAVVAAFVLGASFAPTASAAEYGPKPSMSKEAFIAGAMEVGGFTLEEAEARWADPAARERTPVKLEVISWEEPARLATVAEKERATRAYGAEAISLAAASVTKTFTTKARVTSFGGVELATLTSKKSFIYNGVRAWHNGVTATPWGNNNLGYYYAGAGASSDTYLTIGGVAYSASRSIREAGFTDANGYSLTLGTRQDGRYNGVTDWATY